MPPIVWAFIIGALLLVATVAVRLFFSEEGNLWWGSLRVKFTNKSITAVISARHGKENVIDNNILFTAPGAEAVNIDGSEASSVSRNTVIQTTQLPRSGFYFRSEGGEGIIMSGVRMDGVIMNVDGNKQARIENSIIRSVKPPQDH